MARRDGAWLYKAVSSETLPGKESRGKAVGGSEQRCSAKLKPGLHHEGLAEMGDGLSRRPTAMAMRRVGPRCVAGDGRKKKNGAWRGDVVTQALPRRVAQDERRSSS